MENNHNMLKISLQEIDMPFRYHESCEHAKHWDSLPKEVINIDDYDIRCMEDFMESNPLTDLQLLEKLS